jgi:hypothetical protein
VGGTPPGGDPLGGTPPGADAPGGVPTVAFAAAAGGVAGALGLGAAAATDAGFPAACFGGALWQAASIAITAALAN